MLWRKTVSTQPVLPVMLRWAAKNGMEARVGSQIGSQSPGGDGTRMGSLPVVSSSMQLADLVCWCRPFSVWP